MALSGNGLRLFASNEGYDCKSHNYCKSNYKNLFHFSLLLLINIFIIPDAKPLISCSESPRLTSKNYITKEKIFQLFATGFIIIFIYQIISFTYGKSSLTNLALSRNVFNGTILQQRQTEKAQVVLHCCFVRTNAFETLVFTKRCFVAFTPFANSCTQKQSHQKR